MLSGFLDVNNQSSTQKNTLYSSLQRQESAQALVLENYNQTEFSHHSVHID